ncbi:MAG TPA: 50S ribosomal protein L11 methyltransferase [Peptococcaceae bacterium]|nr:50S ribosomal protein L11 methyltransferase [Peptococcaceae bacterium]
MNWLEIAVTVSSEGEEAVTDLFYRIGCQGVVVESPELIKQYIDSGAWDYHEFQDLKPTGECVIKGYLPEDERLEVRLVSLREEILMLKGLFPEWTVRAETIKVKEEDWANEWKRYFKPIRVGKHLLIKPTWEDVDKVDEDVVLIELDPGMAFGTGTHPTTTLCLEAIEEYVSKGKEVFDIGTGSGILAIAAAKLGAKVQAADIDSLAVTIAEKNARLNGVQDLIRLETGNLGEAFKGQADVVVANIIADVIIEILPQLPILLKRDGVFIASGIIKSRVDDVVHKMVQAGLFVQEQKEDSGWVLLVASWASLNNIDIQEVIEEI